MSTPAVEWGPLLPLVVVAGTALVVLLVDLATPGRDREALAWISVAGLALAAGLALRLWGERRTTLASSFVLDEYAVFFDVLLCAAAAVVLLMSVDYLETIDVEMGDYCSLVLFATAGMITMAGANDLVVVFLGLELMSVAVYVLAGIWRQDLRSNEAALKYFLLGAFATGFLLFGMALILAALGTTRLDLVAAALAEGGPASPELLHLGIGLLVVGFGFKIAAVPFHGWAPDVYEGAPTSVTALMAVGVKAAAFAAFARVFLIALGSVVAEWSVLLAALAVLTMTVGNLFAISQTNAKRLLAYSSIAHAGYALVAMVAGGAEGGASLLFYLLAYAMTNLGAFGVVLALARRGETNDRIESFAGLGFRRPLLGLAMTACLLSLTGVPPFVGFAAKFYVFGAAVAEGWVWLAVVGVLNSVVSAYYYIWWIVVMYVREGGVSPVALSARPYLAASIGLSVGATTLFGLFPGPMVAAARASFAALL